MLGIVRGQRFYGVVGTETISEFNGATICIGDTVVAEENEHTNMTVGPVLVFRDNIGIMGRGATPMDDSNISEIVQSHKELKAGDSIYDGYFEVVELNGFK